LKFLSFELLGWAGWTGERKKQTGGGDLAVSDLLMIIMNSMGVMERKKDGQAKPLRDFS